MKIKYPKQCSWCRVDSKGLLCTYWMIRLKYNNEKECEKCLAFEALSKYNNKPFGD